MLNTIRKPEFLKIYSIPLISVSIGSMSNSIAILYALDLGATILQVNLISTVRSTMAILLLIPFGILSDRYGRKPMILYPRAIMLIGTFIRVFARTPIHLIIASIVGGFAGGSYFPILLSMIADISNEEEQREGISTLFLFSSIGMVVGPSIAAFLLLFPQITMRNIYQITAFAELGTLIYLTLVIKETYSPEEKEKTAFLPHIKELISKTSFQGLISVAFLYSFYHSIFRTYAPIFGRLYLNLSDAQVASNYTFMVIILFLVGVSFGAFRILTSTLVAKYSVHENRGLANSLLNFSQSTGNLVNIFTSSMAENFGLVPVFLLGGVTCLSSIIPALRTKLGR